MNKSVFLILLALTLCGCNDVRTLHISENKTQSIQPIPNVNPQGEELGNLRFTTSDRQYLGCWVAIQVKETAEPELKFFQLLDNTLQTSKMSKSIAYSEVESNNYEDYFVLRTKSRNHDLLPYLSVNMISDDEMTIQEFVGRNEVTNGVSVNY